MIDSGCLWTLMSQFDRQWVSVDTVTQFDGQWVSVDRVTQFDGQWVSVDPYVSV